jgi:hypothetical protein
MKKLLLILLCLPMIGFGQNIIKPQQEIKEAIIPPDDKILKMLSFDIISDTSFDRETMLFYERKMEGNGFVNTIVSYCINEEEEIKATIELLYSRKNGVKKSEVQALNARIIKWNTEIVYEFLAAQKKYNLGEILSQQFEKSIHNLFVEPFELDRLYRTKRTYNEAKEEGSIDIYILREIASKIIYLILILLFIALIKYVIRKKRKREIKQ